MAENPTLEDKVHAGAGAQAGAQAGQQAAGPAPQQQIVYVPVPQKKKRHIIRNTALGLGGALALTMYGIKRALYPPSVKKYLKVGVALTAGYAALHPVATVRFVSHTADSAYHWAEGLVTKREAATEAIDKTKNLESTLSQQEKDLQEAQKVLERETGMKSKLQTDYNQATGLLRTKDQMLSSLRSENEELLNQLSEKDKKLSEAGVAAGVQNEPSSSSAPSTIYNNETAKPAAALGAVALGMPNTVKTLESKLVQDFDNIIYVDKETNKLSVYQKDGAALKRVRVYNCSTGKNPGPKTGAGDLATPEGVFPISFRNFKPNLGELYGAGFIGAKSEYSGFGICGAAIPERISAIRQGEACTNSCVIMENANLLDLDEIVGHDYSKSLLIVEAPSRPLIR